MKKKTLAMLMMAAALSLTACGNKEVNENGNAADVVEDTAKDAVENKETEGAEEDTAEDASAYAEDVATADLVAAVAESLGENYWPNMDIDAAYLENMVGLTADMYEEAAGQMPMISANVDTLITVKAKADTVGEVEAALKAYQEMLQNDTMQYPANLGKIQASKVETFGNYVCFVQLGADTTALESEEAVIAQCEAENEKALAAIEEKLVK